MVIVHSYINLPEAKFRKLPGGRGIPEVISLGSIWSLTKAAQVGRRWHALLQRGFRGLSGGCDGLYM